MLDKTSKDFLAYLEKMPSHTMDWSGDLPTQFGSGDGLRAMVRYLNNLGYTERVTSQYGASLAVQLSHKGLKRKEFQRQELLRYLEEKWIDFFFSPGFLRRAYHLNNSDSIETIRLSIAAVRETKLSLLFSGNGFCAPSAAIGSVFGI